MFQRPQPLRVNTRDDVAVLLEGWLERAFERCSRARAKRQAVRPWLNASLASQRGRSVRRAQQGKIKQRDDSENGSHGARTRN